MGGKKLGLRWLIPLFIAILIVEYFAYTLSVDKEEPIKQISLIVYGSDTARWESLKQGAELYAKEQGAEITLITMASEDDAKEQISLINREIVNGADALLIAACDSEIIDAYMKEKDIRIPFVYVESGGTTDENLIAANNEKMGLSLAENIHENEKDWIKIAVIAENLKRENVSKRLKGLMDANFKYAEEVVLWERNEQEKDTKAMLFLQRELTEEAVDVVVALDDSSMDALLDATINLNKDIKIYGIANDDKAVYYLDNSLIKSLVFQDEFSMGYLGVAKLLFENPDKKDTKDVNYYVVKREDIYQDNYQKILFPLVK